MSKFLVVVHPPKPEMEVRISGMQSGPPQSSPPKVAWIAARDSHAALGHVQVPPGGHALVVREADVQRFDRAKQAPLVEHMPDGQPIPQAVEA